MKYKTHNYECTIQWDQGRRGSLSSQGLPGLSVTAPVEFKGHTGAWTPEHLFVAALNTCFWLTYIGTAERKNLRVLDFKSRAEGLLEFGQDGYVFTRVDIYPEIGLVSDDNLRLAEDVAREAEKNCLVAKSVNCRVEIHPLFKTLPVAQEPQALPV